jgi:hypothetical protein
MGFFQAKKIEKLEARIAELEEVHEANLKAIQINADVFADGMKKIMALCDAKDARIAELEAALDKYKEDELLLSRDGVHFRKAMDVVKEQSARIAALEAALKAVVDGATGYKHPGLNVRQVSFDAIDAARAAYLGTRDAEKRDP